MRYYKPLKVPKSLRPQLIATWDLETTGLGGACVFSSYCVLDSEGNIVESGYAKNQPLNKVLEVMRRYNSHTWFAHNSNYDWRYYLPFLNDAGVELEIYMCTDTKILSVEFEHIEMLDSYFLYPHSLEKFSKQFSPDHAKLKARDIENFDVENEEDISYAVRDSESLALSIYNYYLSFKNIWGVWPSRTAASSALKAWRTTMLKEINPDSKYENFYRHCYYGGFVSPLHTGIFENVKTFDINSSYPAAMRKGVPGGTRIICNSSEDYTPGSIGYWICEVQTPDNLIVPVIPYRKDPPHKVGNINPPNSSAIYPKGNFVTCITTPEIEFAKSIGYKIKPLKGIEFETLEFPFNDFIDKCEQLRAEHKGTSLEQVVKLNQNSLYGKFGTKRLRRRVDLIPEDNPEGWTPLDVLEGFGFITEEAEEVLCAPEIAGWITAQARLALFKAIYDGGAEHVLYCDTDSITVTDKFDQTKISVGNKYGQFKHEKTWSKFRAHAPKVYAGIIDGEFKGACKGIPKPTAQDFEKIFNGEIIEKEYLSLNSVMSYFIYNVKAEAEKRLRKSTVAENCSAWGIKHKERTELIVIG